MAGVRDLTKITDHIVPELYRDSAVWKEFVDALFDSNYQILNNSMGKTPCLRTLADNEMVDCPKRVLPMYDLSDLPLQHDGGSLYNLMAVCAQRGVRLSSDNDVQFSWELDKQKLQAYTITHLPETYEEYFVNTGLKFSAKPYEGWNSKSLLNAMKFNQLIKNGDFSTSEDIWKHLIGDTGSHSIQKGRMDVTGSIETILNTDSAHSYYISFEVRNTSNSAKMWFNSVHESISADDDWVRYSFIKSTNVASTHFQFTNMANSSIRNIWVVDLTYWSEDIEIEEPEDFEVNYPSRYYEYLPIEDGPYGSPEMQNMYIAFYDADGVEATGSRKGVYCLHNGVAQVANLSGWDIAVSTAASVKLLCSLPLDRFTWYLKFPTEDTRLVGQRSIPFFDECLAVTDRIAPGTERRRVTFEMEGAWTDVPLPFIETVGEAWSRQIPIPSNSSHITILMGGVDVTVDHLSEEDDNYIINFDEGEFTGNVIVRGVQNEALLYSITMSGTNFTSDAPSLVPTGTEVVITINATADAYLYDTDVTVPSGFTKEQRGDSCVIVSGVVTANVTITANAYKYHVVMVEYGWGTSVYPVTCNSPMSFSTKVGGGHQSVASYDADFAVITDSSYISGVSYEAVGSATSWSGTVSGLQVTRWQRSFNNIPADATSVRFTFTTFNPNYTITESISQSAEPYADVLLSSTKSNTATIWDKSVDYHNVIDYVDGLWYDRNIRLHLIIDGIDRTSSLPAGASINYYMVGSTHRVDIVIPKNSVTSTLEFRYM